MSRSTLIAMFLAAGLAVAAGCRNERHRSDQHRPQPTQASEDATLYDRLGGEPAIRAVVEDFVPRTAANPKVNFTRAGHPNQWDPSPANVKKLKQRLVEFISMATGGPDNYKGRDMITAHTGMMIRDPEFDAMAADLIASLDKLKVAKRERDELIAVIEATRGQIVGK